MTISSVVMTTEEFEKRESYNFYWVANSLLGALSIVLILDHEMEWSQRRTRV